MIGTYVTNERGQSELPILHLGSSWAVLIPDGASRSGDRPWVQQWAVARWVDSFDEAYSLAVTMSNERGTVR